MTREPRAARRRAAVLVILAAALWWHEWMPALLVVTFVGWVVLHKRFEDERGEGDLRVWRRVWPPATLVLVVLIVAGTAVYWVSNHSVEAKVLPIALNAVALSMLVVGRKRAVAMRVRERSVDIADMSVSVREARGPNE